jgi:uncharacterized protein (UPF0264 family)
VAKLLVSVRSQVEALCALAGGAAVIDVKEPLRGPLGRAPFAVWRDVRQIVPARVAVSVALGELTTWLPWGAIDVPPGAFAGLAYCKLGLANAPPDWVNRWRDLRQRLAESESFAPAWVAVVYLDWRAARAPAPEAVIDAANAIDTCAGVLFDTWDKTQSPGISLEWKPMVDRARASGRLVALAGSLNAEAIGRLASLHPDLFAVRGAACAGGDRMGSIDLQRVSALARAMDDHIDQDLSPDVRS